MQTSRYICVSFPALPFPANTWRETIHTLRRASLISETTFVEHIFSVIFSVRDIEDLENDETSFGPEMCHQVFGENENIFGYTDLHIKLFYSAGSLQTYLGIEYTEKVNMDMEWSLLHSPLCLN